MTTFTTKIDEIKVIPTDAKFGLKEVVFIVSFTVTGVDGQFKNSVSRGIGLGAPDPANFTPLDQITNEQMLSFVNGALAPDDMRVIQNEINEAIEQQKNPQAQPFVIPWNK